MRWRWHKARVDFWWFWEHHGDWFGAYRRRKRAERECVNRTGRNYYGDVFEGPL